AHVRLAQVVTGPASVLSIADERVGPRSCGTAVGYVLKSGDTVSGPFSVAAAVSGTTAFAVQPDVPAVGFFGAAPASQAPALTPLTDSPTGPAPHTVVD